MIIKSAIFKGSFKTVEQCPPSKLPEFAFIGRSNVGKSSLINMLLSKKDLVKVSGRPGKTQSINHFLINDGFYFVDLPGYGFASVSKKEKHTWKKMIADFLQKREQLLNTFVLIDARHEPLKIDLEFINQFGEWQIPFSIVFTKADKVGKDVLASHKKMFEERLSESWENLPPIFISSAEEQIGRDEIFGYVEEMMKEK
ncbi:putative GTP-binding protein EngB [Bacteroidota bacterium]|nr:putative GTP-binding protein EngB [Bacteroidota bacterium]